MKRLKDLITDKNIRSLGFSPAVFIVLLFLHVNSFSQEIVDTDPETPGVQQPISPVKIDGKEFFNVRGITSFPAEQRATAISKRIREAAADTSVSPDSVKVIVNLDHSLIYAGDKFIMNIFDIDADVEGISRELFTRIVSQAITDAIELYRNNRTTSVLIRKSLNGIGALILTILLVFLSNWLFRKLDVGLQKLIRKRIDTVENKSFNIIRAKNLWKTYHLVLKTIRILFLIIIIAVLINYLFSLFPWTSNLETYILSLLVDPFLSLGKSLLNFLPSLIFLIIIYLVTRYILKLGKLFFSNVQNNRITIKNFDPDWALPTFTIVRTLVIVFALVIAYPYIPGSGTSAFKGISVFLGILLSLGSSSFISNMIAGYTMTYRGAFKRGDFIQVGEKSGFVQENKILDTRIFTIQNEEVIIPNSVLLNSNIINYSTKARNESLIIHTSVGIGYETPWRLVDAMLKLAADRTEGLLKQPPPFVLKRSLGDFAITYEINAYCNDASRLHFIYSVLHQNILDVFNENNVQIMTPGYMQDPSQPKIVPKEQWHTPLTNEEQGNSAK